MISFNISFASLKLSGGMQNGYFM